MVNNSALRLMLSCVLVLALSAEGHGERSYRFQQPLVQFEVSETLYRKLDEIEDQFQPKIEALEKALTATHRTLREHEFDRDSALEAALTADQLSTLNEQRRKESKENARSNVKFLSEFSKFLVTFSAADELTVYEGLPRATDEQLDKLEREHETVEIGGSPFYAEPLTVKPAIAERLRSGLVDCNNFQRYVPKFCGGFHADFCVVWTANCRANSMQICLGCSEALFVSSDEMMFFDFNDAAWKSFAQFAVATFVRHGDVIKEADKKRDERLRNGMGHRR